MVLIINLNFYASAIKAFLNDLESYNRTQKKIGVTKYSLPIILPAITPLLLTS